MYLKQYENLNWNNANVLEFKYLYYLAQMVNERSTKIGVLLNQPIDFNYSNYSIYNSCPFDMLDFQPNGYFRFKHIQSLYFMMINLGLYIYYNPDSLSEDNFEYGDNRMLFGYSLNDMCDIANFDFFANPLIPNQPLNYYNKFLKPIHDVLAQYRYYWTNTFQSFDKKMINYHGPATLPTKTIDGDTYIYNGPDKINYEGDFNNCLNEMIAGSGIQDYPNTNNRNGAKYVLGAEIYFTYDQFVWKGYKGNYSDYEKCQGIKWLDIRYQYQNYLRPLVPLLTNSPYTLYLYHTTYYDFYWMNQSSNIHLKYFRSPYDNIITVNTGTISQKFPTLHINLPTQWVFNTDTSDIDIKQFWQQRVNDYNNTYYNSNQRTQNGCIAYYYKPLLIVDYHSHFNHF